MGHKQARNTQIMNRLPQPASEFLTHLGINGGKRLVQKQNFWIRCQSPGKGHPLTLTAGKLLRITLGHRRKPRKLQQFIRAYLDGMVVHILYPQAKGEIIPHRHMAEQRVILKHKANAPLPCRNLIDPPPGNPDIALIRLF